MSYRITRVDNEIEKKFLIGLIVSPQFIREIKPYYNPDLILIPFVRLVAKWCFDYYDRFEQAPMRHIQDLYEHYRRKIKDGEDTSQTRLIEEFLSGLSHEYEHAEHFNVEYLLEQAMLRFESRNQIMHAEDILAYNAKGDVESGKKAIATYRSVQRAVSSGINPYSNAEAIQKAFENTEGHMLFSFPGALRRLLKGVYRHDCIMVMGRAKIGKTWVLQELSDRAYKNKNNVAFFECGDMSQDELVQRIGVHNTGMNWDKDCCGEIELPVLDCRHNQDDSCTLPYRTGRGIMGHREPIGNNKTVWVEEKLSENAWWVPCTYCQKESPENFEGAVWHKQHVIETLNWKAALAAGTKIAKRLNRNFRLSVHAATSINVKGIEAQLDVWESQDGFIPDVVFIDYADILAPEQSLRDRRDQINETWLAIRSLGQRRHCAMITATQADAESYHMRTLREENFANDRRKYDHVTRVITLNQTDDEKERRIYRIGTMFVRSSKFDPRATVTILQCLEAGAPYLGSFLTREERQ